MGLCYHLSPGPSLETDGCPPRAGSPRTSCTSLLQEDSRESLFWGKGLILSSSLWLISPDKANRWGWRLGGVWIRWAPRWRETHCLLCGLGVDVDEAPLCAALFQTPFKPPTANAVVQLTSLLGLQQHHLECAIKERSFDYAGAMVQGWCCGTAPHAAHPNPQLSPLSSAFSVKQIMLSCFLSLIPAMFWEKHSGFMEN